jgi:hypothetical protein
MFYSSLQISFAARLIALAMVFALTAGKAEAQVKPFKISGGGIAPQGLPLPGEDPRPHWAIGEATHMGRYFGEGTFRNNNADFSDLPNGRITGTFESGSPFVFTAANGDKLVCYYGRTDKNASQHGHYELTIVDVLGTGQLLVNAQFVAEFVVQPNESTGHFAGVTGSWIMVAKSDKPFLLPSTDPLYYSWEGEGRLNFPKH